MQIGEFAKLCHTKITVLRHYDKQGLLIPDYIDYFTGYRYYSREQVHQFKQITALKEAGFSLFEIREILHDKKTSQEIIQQFEKKKEDLIMTLQNLEVAKKMMLGEHNMNMVIIENQVVKLKINNENEIDRAFSQITDTLNTYGYQRTSSFHTSASEVSCSVLKLSDQEIIIKENIDLPFENDPQIIGKWEIIGEYALKEDFFSQVPTHQPSYPIYFLENGERFWSYSWTKGKLMIDDDVNTTVNHYHVETINQTNYMFVDLKSYHYRHGGKTTTLVLKQIDHHMYKASDLVRKDDIDLPFVDDPTIIGKWKAIAYCQTKESFDPDHLPTIPLYLTQMNFKDNGEIESYYDYGKEIIKGKKNHEWTKGYWLRNWNQCACAYEIQTINDVEYLFIEWKSGNYRWGGFETDYYVLVREEKVMTL